VAWGLFKVKVVIGMSDRKVINVTDDDIRKLKKHRRLSGRDFVIDVVDRSTSDIKMFGRHKRKY